MAVTERARLSLELGPLDRVAVGAIVLGYVVVTALMPPVRDFALLDDWVYTRLAEGIVHGQGLAPSQYAQATLIFHEFWGAGFVALLGDTFTAVTLATVTLSLLGALAFYAILRVLGFSTSLSALGVAILVLNPYYLYLSYTYMTEVTFTSMALISCFCYLLGICGNRTKDDGPKAMDNRGAKMSASIVWLALGGLFAALAFLTRQFGLALPVAALAWLFVARKMTITKALAVLALPLVAVIGYYVWSSKFGTTFSGSVGREEILELANPGEWAQRAARFVYFALFLPGLTVPLWSKPRRWRVGLALSVLGGVAAFGLWQLKLRLASEGQSSLDELSFTWLRPVFGDGVLITLVYSVGAGLAVWLLFGMAERAWPALVGIFTRKMEAPPALLFFLAGAILFAGTYVVSAGFLDRYWVPVLPFLIAGGLYGVKRWSWRLLVPALAVVGVFGALVHLDDYAAMQARWDAGRDLLASGVPVDRIENGYAWDGYYLGDSSMARYPNLDVRVIGRIFPPYEVIVPDYVIDNVPMEGYTIVDRYRYFSYLNGWGYREMLVLKR